MGEIYYVKNNGRTRTGKEKSKEYKVSKTDVGRSRKEYDVFTQPLNSLV